MLDLQKTKKLKVERLIQSRYKGIFKRIYNKSETNEYAKKPLKINTIGSKILMEI